MQMDNRELLLRAKQGDQDAREQLVEGNIRLVHSIVKRFTMRGYESEDLFQIGCIGLVKAIDKFDDSFQVQFSTYAVPLIMGEIKRFMRDDGMVKISRSVKENSWKINRCISDLIKMNGREPNIEEIEKVTGIDKEDILLAMETSKDVESIYKTVCGGEGKELCLIDQLKDEKNDAEKVLNHAMLEQLIQELDDMEKEIIIMRYYNEMTQSDIAKKLKISQVQVSRLERKILMQMRKKIEG